MKVFGVGKNQLTYLKTDFALKKLESEQPHLHDNQRFYIEYIIDKQSFRTVKELYFIVDVGADVINQFTSTIEIKEDPFEHISSFVLNKKKQWEPKKGEIKLFCSHYGRQYKLLAKKQYDISKHIGEYPPQPVNIRVSKQISVEFTIQMVPADPKAHQDLFFAANKLDARWHRNTSEVVKRVTYQEAPGAGQDAEIKDDGKQEDKKEQEGGNFVPILENKNQLEKIDEQEAEHLTDPSIHNQENILKDLDLKDDEDDEDMNDTVRKDGKVQMAFQEESEDKVENQV